MTASVCTSCGAMKIGALTRCTKCKFEAGNPVERAKAMLLTDHHLDRAGLAAASAAIQSGEGVQYDEAQVAEIAEGIASAPVPGRIGIIMVSVGFLMLLGAVGLMIFLVIRWVVSLVG